MLSQHPLARVPAKVLLLGPRNLYLLGWAYALNWPARQASTSVTPGLGWQLTQLGSFWHGSGELSHFCADVVSTGVSVEFWGQRGLITAYRFVGVST